MKHTVFLPIMMIFDTLAIVFLSDFQIEQLVRARGHSHPQRRLKILVNFGFQTRRSHLFQQRRRFLRSRGFLFVRLNLYRG